jgi:GT2 family glycosyltransferase
LQDGEVAELTRRLVEKWRAEEPGPEAALDAAWYAAWAQRHPGQIVLAPEASVIVADTHAAANRAVKTATSAYLIFLEPGDALTEHAAARLAAALKETPGAMVYADHDYRTAAGLVAPCLKPDFSPERLLEQPYMATPIAMPRALFEAVGRFRPQGRGALLPDLVLRASERAPVVHVREILCHKAQAPALGAAHDPVALRRVVSSALRRRNVGARLTPGRIMGSVRVRPSVPARTRVSIIIPFRDRAELLDQCLASLAEKTRFTRYEIILVDNGSVEARTTESIIRWKRALGARVLTIPGPFNYAELNNRAARVARGDQLLLLNNDTQIIERDWLSALIEWSVRPEVGAVGPMLLYPDRTIQHAGLVLGVGGGSVGHAFLGLPEDTEAGFGAAQVVRNVSALTGACLMIGREKFRRAGGLDQEQFRVTYNDVALCLQLSELGLRNVYTPHARLVHFESKTRAQAPHIDEDRAFFQRYRAQLANDPYYHPWLSRRATDYRLER